MDNRKQFVNWVNEAPNQRYGAVYWECWQACAEQKDAEIAELKADKERMSKLATPSDFNRERLRVVDKELKELKNRINELC